MSKTLDVPAPILAFGNWILLQEVLNGSWHFTSLSRLFRATLCSGRLGRRRPCQQACAQLLSQPMNPNARAAPKPCAGTPPHGGHTAPDFRACGHIGHASTHEACRYALLRSCNAGASMQCAQLLCEALSMICLKHSRDDRGHEQRLHCACMLTCWLAGHHHLRGADGQV